MRIAYFDCFAGVSGDMTLGALLDSGVDESRLREELGKLKGVEFELRVSKAVKNGIEATDVDVVFEESHHHRHLKHIVAIIEESVLSQPIKDRAIGIFRRLAEAEGSVHGTGPEQVHFHEVGAVDAIVDIVGASIGIELLGADRVVVSPLPMGHGFVKAAHGLIPLPAPATVEILKGVPVYPVDVKGELVTPTGAAIVRSLASEFGAMPEMSIKSIGYGSGKKDFEFPNTLRIIVGETSGIAAPSHRVDIVETNIDDMNPEFYDTVFEKLFAVGALDVYLTPIHMKKNRPATLLSAICPPDKTPSVAETVLRETSSFGVRVTSATRYCLDRTWQTVSTEYGDIRVKIGKLHDEALTVSPEYEDCKSAARASAVPVRRVYEAAVARLQAADCRPQH